MRKTQAWKITWRQYGEYSGVVTGIFSGFNLEDALSLWRQEVFTKDKYDQPAQDLMSVEDLGDLYVEGP